MQRCYLVLSCIKLCAIIDGDGVIIADVDGIIVKLELFSIKLFGGSPLNQLINACSGTFVHLNWSANKLWENATWLLYASVSKLESFDILCKSVWLKCKMLIQKQNKKILKIILIPFKIALPHNCTCTSGIFDANCIAGETIFILSFEFPILRKTWLSNTKEHDVKRFKSSAFAIFNVSRR